MKKTITFKQLKKLVKESSTEKTWRGVPGTKFIWNGEWADPEVEYDGEIINANDLDDFVFDQYQLDCKYSNKEATEVDFDSQPISWFKRQLDDYMFGKFGDVNEANEPQIAYTWNINELRDTGYGMESWKMVEGADDTFATEDEARKDGIKHLKQWKIGDYELEIWDNDDSPNLVSVVEIHDNEITEY